MLFKLVQTFKKAAVRVFIPVILSMISFSSFSQSKYTISGYVKDEKSGEALIGSSVYVKELTNVGAMTNEYGFYSLTLAEG
ncbi:MAG: carboxypeptidase-like regulatory domain-containing protein, partial [Cytophagaceae bacterium]|nr:carboxypeptidase-like regulatory domain-containing protein [Cytophagaceae bacterium]